MKERPIIFNSEMVRAILDGRKTQTRRVIKPQPGDIHRDLLRINYHCPYGQPGDHLWVRETFQIDDNYPDMVFYKADDLAGHISTKWNSPIYMPRCDSRITLEITNRRVERVQDITEEDAMAEGVGRIAGLGEYRQCFKNLWDSINKKRDYGWDTNPYVWVIEFKRISQ
jgi:hypothetical protein